MSPTTLKNLPLLLFGLLIFFLPSNLAYHFFTATATVQGTLVDYLIPKLYLTDLFILGIFILSIPTIRGAVKRHLGGGRYRLLRGVTPWIITFFSVTLIHGLLAPYPLAALWFWFKLLEMTLFAWWLKTHLSLAAIRYTLIAGLTMSVLWQSILAIAQWLSQSSIIGYWFLGEPVFSITTPGIAKTTFLGAVKVLPYGTTPHPNVLAGFLVFSLVILFGSSFGSTISKYIAGITLLLTQSLSAWLALGLIVLFIGLKTTFSTKMVKLLTTFALLSGLTLFILLSTKSSLLDSESFSRRYKLNLVAIKIWADYPLFGTGLNQFTPYLSQYAQIEASTRFLQPVHNIYLLLLSETGLIGLALVILILRQFVKKFSIPLIALLIIGLFDHYPFTLQTGQLLLAISLALAAAKSPSSAAPPVR